MTVPSLSKAKRASRTGDRLTLNISPSPASGSRSSRLEGFIKNRIPDLLNNQERRFLDLLFIIPSLLDERTLHKFKLSCLSSSKWRWNLSCDWYHLNRRHQTVCIRFLSIAYCMATAPAN